MLSEQNEFFSKNGAHFNEAGSLQHFGTPFANAFAYNQHLAVLTLTGEDAREFLQGQLTCDMADVDNGKPRLAGHLSLQGRVLFSAWVLPLENGDGYQLLIPQQRLDDVNTTWQKYLMFSRSKLEQNHNAIVLSASQETAAQLCKALNLEHGAYAKNEHWQAFSQNGLSYFVGQLNTLTEHWQALTDIGTAGGVQQAQWWEIQHSVPFVYAGADNKFLPQALNYDLLEGISFNKGCYTGQEVVARMKFKGKLKQRLQHISWPEDTPCQPGDPLRDANDRAVGHIIIGQRQQDATHALAVLRRDKELPSRFSEQEITVACQPLPYELPELGN